MNFKVKVFLSYSIEDKPFADNIVNTLKNYPFIDIFIAPENIKAGTFWVDELKYNLKNSDVILALLTDNYHKASWTDQEIGLAWAFEKRILALSIDDHMGKGYVNTIQIKKFPREFKQYDITDLAIELYPTIKNNEEFVEGLLKFALLASTSFFESNAVAKIVRRLIDRLEPHLAGFVVEAYCKNDQVYQSMGLDSLIEKAFCTDNPFINFNQEQKKKILNFMKEKFPDYHQKLQKKISDFKNNIESNS